MSTYTKITDFAAKDALLTGNPSKIVKGTEIGAEFDSIATADASNVKGPTSAVTDNAVVRWDTTTGRISQGSSVTIDDSGNISGTSFSGAHNGTVGATTPSTGAFTTLSASSGVTNTGGQVLQNATLAVGTASVQALGASGAARDIAVFGQSGYSNGFTVKYNGSNMLYEFKDGGSNVAAISSTGLSVTGALSATGDATIGLNNYGKVKWTNGTSTVKWSAYNEGVSGTDKFYLDDASGNHVLTATQSGGLAITGALSSTGAITTTVTGSTFSATGATTSSRYSVWNNTGGGATIGVESSAGNVIIAGTTGYEMSLSGNAGIAFSANNGSSLQMKLDTSGNLGLGVTPSAWGTYTGVLESKYGSHLATFTDQLVLGLNSYFNGSSWIYKNNNYATRYYQNSGAHSWYNAPSGTAGNAITFTQAMTLDASGNLLVGTTTNTYAALSGFVINGPTAGTYTSTGHVSGTGSGASYSIFTYNGGIIGSITQSGTTAVLYNTTSDQRLKENVADAESASSLIDSLQVRQFDWKADGSHQRYGFVAQELVTVAPEAVHQPANPEDMMAVDYSKLVPMLVKEIQSLRARLAAAGIA